MSFFQVSTHSGMCQLQIFLVTCIFIQKKKTTRTLVWVKNTKVMPQMPRYLSFLLGKGGNPYVSNPMKS